MYSRKEEGEGEAGRTARNGFASLQEARVKYYYCLENGVVVYSLRVT